MAKAVLEGIRVTDLTMGWAGPLATQILADLGAEVIKVESHTHMDWWRAPITSEEAYWERSALFNSVNQNKLGVSIDLSTERGIDLIRELIRRSDILAENFAPRVMEHFGLGYDKVRTVNPDIIMVSMPALGLSGPWRDFVGVGSTAEALGGITIMSGYEGEEPRIQSNAYGDPNAGLNGALATLMAIRHKRRTGKGQHIEVAHVDAMIPQVGAALMDFQMNGRIAGRKGNSSDIMAPHGCYPTKGDDEWVTIAVASDSQWAALAGVIGPRELADDGRFKRTKDRLRFRTELDAIVSRWTRERERQDITALLQENGIAAGPVLNSAEQLQDRHLNEIGFFYEMDRAFVGRRSYPNSAIKLSKTPVTRRTPAPVLGEHNDQVLGGLLGLSEGQVQELKRNGVISREPISS